jgi:hypothetical protein
MAPSIALAKGGQSARYRPGEQPRLNSNLRLVAGF